MDLDVLLARESLPKDEPWIPPVVEKTEEPVEESRKEFLQKELARLKTKLAKLKNTRSKKVNQDLATKRSQLREAIKLIENELSVL